MSREYRLYLNDMIEACERVLRYTEGLNAHQFFSSDMVYDAVMRNLEIIGEAAKAIPDEVRTQAPDIEWRKVAGLRDVLAHVYSGIDNQIVWDVIHSKIPELLNALRRL